MKNDGNQWQRRNDRVAMHGHNGNSSGTSRQHKVVRPIVSQLAPLRIISIRHLDITGFKDSCTHQASSNSWLSMTNCHA